MTIDIKTIRKDFPQYDDKAEHYLDSASTSLTPRVVLDAVREYYEKDRANVHRGEYATAARATERYESARRSVASLIGAEASEIVLTSGATEASNMLIRSIEESIALTPGDEIVTTVMEHHSSSLPLQQLAKRRGLVLKHIPMKQDLTLDMDEAKKLIGVRTKVVSAMLASNVIGTINDIASIAALAKERGALMISDATAAAGHMPIDVLSLGVDALYFSGHKLLAPTGVGVLWMNEKLADRLSPSEFGGHMVAEAGKDDAVWETGPAKFEAGTKDIGGVIGLGAAVEYLAQVGVAEVKAHTERLVLLTIAELSKIPGIAVHAQRDPAKNIGIVSFTADWAHPHDLGEIATRGGVSIRTGHHCAMPLHFELGVRSTARASFHLYNDEDDVRALVGAIEKARSIFA